MRTCGYAGIPVCTAFISIIAVLGVFVTVCGENPAIADLILINGKIITMDDAVPEAEAVAIHGDIIAAVGSTEDIQRHIGQGTEIIDLQGMIALPGFIESHAHLIGLGQSKMILDLTTARSWSDIVAMVGSAVGGKQPGAWITGRGWHQDKWADVPSPNIGGLPYHDDLDRVAPVNPVLLTHASGHSCLANAAAMIVAGITRDTPDPEGGTIVRDAEGRPIGAFLEAAMDTLYAALDSAERGRTPGEIAADTRRAVSLAVQECLARGITTFHDAGASFAEVDIYKQMAREDSLGIRLWIMLSEDNDSLNARIDDYRLVGYGNNFLTVRAVKRYVDGALGSHGAWLLEPYDDRPGSSGLNTGPFDELRETARIAAEHGFQMCTHAIGDRGNREMLNLYEEIFAARPDKSDWRWRIEHAQHIDPLDIPRFGRLGIIAAMQGIHCTSDGPWVPKRLGDRRSREGAYVWRKLMQGGTLICNGTDAPVESADPIANLYASVTRKMAGGRAFYADQCMTRQEALASYTINGAYAAFEEDIKGSITPGKLADITVLSHDILTVPEDQILNTEIMYTIVGGRVRYRRTGE